MIETRKCSVCRFVYPLTSDFYNKTYGKFTARCKNCIKDSSAKSNKKKTEDQSKSNIGWLGGDEIYC